MSMRGVHFGILIGVVIGQGALGEPGRAEEPPPSDWPVFRGNAAQTGVATCTLPDKLEVLWTYKGGAEIASSPVVGRGNVFVASIDGKLTCLALTDGAKKWDYRARAIRATPAYSEGAVYVGDVDGALHCVDAKSGAKRWTVATGGEIVAPASFVAANVLIGSKDHQLYCVDRSGTVLWQYKTKGELHGPAAVVGDAVLLGGCDQTIHVLDAATGRARVSIPMAGHIPGAVATQDDFVFAGCMANCVAAADWKKGAQAWKFQPVKAPQPFFASPAIGNDMVIVCSRDKCVRALDRGTGKEKWLFASKGRIDASPIIAGQRVVALSTDGNLYLLDMEKGVPVTTAAVGLAAGSPAVAGGCIVVGNLAGDVICLGQKRR